MGARYKVILNFKLTDPFKDHELFAAQIVANYFKCDVYLKRPGHRKTPDLLARDVYWEIKSPIGDSKNTIANNFHSARGQSEYIVLNLCRCKMYTDKVLSRVRHYVKSGNHKIKGLLIITKSGKVIDYFASFC